MLNRTISLLHPCPVRRADALAAQPRTGLARLKAARVVAAGRIEGERAAVAFLLEEADAHEGDERGALMRRLDWQERRFLDGLDRLDRVDARILELSAA